MWWLTLCSCSLLYSFGIQYLFSSSTIPADTFSNLLGIVPVMNCILIDGNMQINRCITLEEQNKSHIWLKNKINFISRSTCWCHVWLCCNLQKQTNQKQKQNRLIALILLVLTEQNRKRCYFGAKYNGNETSFSNRSCFSPKN